VPNLVRTGAVKLVKPLVSDSTWARLRSLGAPSIGPGCDPWALPPSGDRPR